MEDQTEGQKESHDEGHLEEEWLHGGISNAGAVTRAGPHVLRPSNPFSPTIHEFLGAIAATGFDGASRPVAIQPDGRERLVYIEGVAPGPPYPAWARADDALASIAALLRRFHAASATFDPAVRTFSPELADPAGGSIVCHNDVCLDNVIFRDGVAVGFVDFDFAAPGRPLYDLAHLARLCVPLEDDGTRALLGWEDADWPARLRVVADAYGLDAAGRGELLALVPLSMRRAQDFIQGRAEAGNPNFQLIWDFMGGAARFERREQWWADHLDAFREALR